MTRQFVCNTCKGTYPDVQSDGTLYYHVCGPLPPDKNGVQLERPDKRDETPFVNRRGRIEGIQAEGKGVTCLTDAKVLEPAWITAANAAGIRADEAVNE